MTLQLSLGMAANPRSRPILDGRVTVAGVDLVPTLVPTSELFWRQLRFADFDVSEMSFSSLMMAIDRGDARWVGLPVFTTREFFHTAILVRRDSGIETPADLRGRRVGVPEYQQTAALWTRGALWHEFGVTPQEIEFWMERVPTHSHAGALGFTPPPGVTIHQIPVEKNIGTMMLSGELEATLRYSPNATLVSRSTADLRGHPDIRPLFADRLAEGIRYYRATGLFPINHGMIVRRRLVEAHPEIVPALLDAFARAAAIADAERQAHVADHRATGLLRAEDAAALQTPLVHYGIAANRRVLETAAHYAQEQGLTTRRVALAEIFAASPLDQ